MSLLRWVPLLACLACASALPRPPAVDDLRSDVVRSARGWMGQRQLRLRGELLPADCLALPQAAFGANGVELGAQSPLALFQRLSREGHVFSGKLPRRGDLVFTRDLRRDRLGSGELHVGLVSRVDPDGTVTVYQRMSRGVEAYRMNKDHPHDTLDRSQREPQAPGRHWNDSIATGNGDAAPAGALFSAYASVLP